MIYCEVACVVLSAGYYAYQKTVITCVVQSAGYYVYQMVRSRM
ncbi:hypothetical protein F383_39220 [Gossypium arboreum]|uniref:Uncharacterized protein n=1 Tax=Gossypium arboreum TaxID=29729 RepID=A0A0B0MP38_GOSAR|nr:hypothetical protein F383_39220 [Gossypium arboreum]